MHHHIAHQIVMPGARAPYRDALPQAQDLLREAEAQRALAELFPHLKLDALRAIQDLFPLSAHVRAQAETRAH
jgi:hypothetical protein